MLRNSTPGKQPPKRKPSSRRIPFCSDRWFSVLMERASDAVFILGLRPNGMPGRYVEVNAGACNKLGYSREELLQLSPCDMEAPECVGTIHERSAKLLADGHAIFESILIAKDGSKIHFETSAHLFTHNGEQAVLSIKRDITERKKTEEAFRSLVVNAPIGIYIVQDKAFKLTNLGFEKTTGYSREELLEKNPLSLVAPEYRNAVRENAVKMLKGESSCPYKFKVVCKNGDAKWIIEVVTPIEYRDRRATLGYFVDTTQQKRMEDALRRSEQEYRDLFFFAPIGIMQSSLDGRVLDANPALARIFGYDSPGELTASIRDLAHQVYIDPSERARLIELLIESENGVCGFEWRCRKRNGETITVSMDARVVRDETGAPHHLESFIEDISERKLMEMELLRAKMELANKVQKRTSELNEKAGALEETNTALKILLNAREVDRKELEESVLANVTNLAMPCIERLKMSRLSDEQRVWMDMLEAHLKRITSPLLKNLSRAFLGLTRTEVRVAGFIREGKTTKDIANILGLTDDAIMFHRRNIRKKLNLNGYKINLSAYLQSLDQ